MEVTLLVAVACCVLKGRRKSGGMEYDEGKHLEHALLVAKL